MLVRDVLSVDEDGFEETRITSIVGCCIYDPTDLRKYVDRYWKKNKDIAGFSILQYDLINSIEDPINRNNVDVIRLKYINEIDSIIKEVDAKNKINKVHQEMGLNKVNFEPMLYGLLVWPAKNNMCRNYFGYIPNDLRAFQIWAESLGIPLTSGLDIFLYGGLHTFVGVPVTVVVPRPQPMIRCDSNLEILNFLIIDEKEYHIKEGYMEPEFSSM
jgi:hypothetical protein